MVVVEKDRGRYTCVYNKPTSDYYLRLLVNGLQPKNNNDNNTTLGANTVLATCSVSSPRPVLLISVWRFLISFRALMSEDCSRSQDVVSIMVAGGFSLILEQGREML